MCILETVETIFRGYPPSEEHKRLAPDVLYTSATRVGLVDDVRDTDCRTQNGGVDDSVFANVDFLPTKIIIDYLWRPTRMSPERLQRHNDTLLL